MYPYILFHIIIILTIFFSYKNRILDEYFSFVLIIISCLFIGGRLEVGADYTEYRDVFYSYSDTRFEPLFNMIFNLARGSILSYNTFSFFLYFLSISIFYIAIKNEKGKVLLLSGFILFMFVPLTSTIRQGLSLPFLALAIYNNQSPKRYFIYCLLGSFFHASALILLPLYVICGKYISIYRMAIFILISLIIGYLQPITIVIKFLETFSIVSGVGNKILTYSTRYNEPMSMIAQLYRVGFILLLLPIWNVISQDRISNFSKNIYIYMFLLTLIFKDNGVLVNRLTFSTNISCVLILGRLLYLNFSETKKYFIFVILFLYFSFSYYKFIYTDLRHSVEKAYLPYENGLFIDVSYK